MIYFWLLWLLLLLCAFYVWVDTIISCTGRNKIFCIELIHRPPSVIVPSHSPSTIYHPANTFTINHLSQTKIFNLWFHHKPSSTVQIYSPSVTVQTIHHLSLCKHIYYWPSVTVWAHSQSTICHCANTSINNHNYVTVQTHPPTTIIMSLCKPIHHQPSIIVQTHSPSTICKCANSHHQPSITV